MKKLFLIILMLTATCTYSQDIKNLPLRKIFDSVFCTKNSYNNEPYYYCRFDKRNSFIDKIKNINGCYKLIVLHRKKNLKNIFVTFDPIYIVFLHTIKYSDTSYYFEFFLDKLYKKNFAKSLANSLFTYNSQYHINILYEHSEWHITKLTSSGM